MIDEKIEEMIKIECKCPFCGTRNILEVSKRRYNLWKIEGRVIQKAFSNLSGDERELLMTGICSSCWDKTFKE